MSKHSLGESSFWVFLRAAKKTDGWEREYRFHAKRRWRFDFALPSKKIAVEIEGGSWSRGRHNRGGGFAADLVKYREATMCGWNVLRFTTEEAINGTAFRETERLISVLDGLD